MKRFMLPIVFVILLSGCKKVEKFAYRGEPGGSLIVATFAEPSNLNPLYPTFKGISPVTDLLFSSLHKDGKNGKVVPCLATSWEYSEDFKRITYYIDKNAKWSDGTPITAKDIVFTFEKMKDPKTKYPLLGRLRFIKSARAIGDYTVEFEFKRMYADELLNSNLYPLPSKIFKGEELQYASYNLQPEVTSGPYIFKEWKKGNYILLEANKGYLYGKPPFDRVIFWFPKSLNELKDELNLKHVDIVLDFPPSEVEKFEGYKNVIEPGNAYTFIGWNLKKYSNKRLRLAFSMAIDKDQLIKDVLGGYGEKDYGPIPPNHWAFNKVLQTKDIPYKPKDATGIISSLGYEDRNKDGYFDKLSVSITVDKNDKINVNVAGEIVNYLKKIGVKAKVIQLDTPEFISSLISKNFDAFILGWTVKKELDPAPIWSSKGVYNFVGYKNKEIDDLIEKGILSLDREEGKKIWASFQTIILNDIPYTFLFVPSRINIVKNGIRGIEKGDHRLLAEHLDELWMPANKRITFDYASLGSHYQKMQKKVTKRPIPVARAPIVTAQNLLQENLNLQTGKEDTAKETGAVKKGEGKTAEKAGKTKTEEVVPIIRTLPQPIPEYAVQPIYPEAAKAVGAQGVVFVQVTVGINGNVKDVKILKSFGNSACDEAAIAAAKKWRFKPGTINGKPSEMTRTIPFNFRLP